MALAAAVALLTAAAADAALRALLGPFLVAGPVLVAVAALGWWPAAAWLGQGTLAASYLLAILARGPDLDTSAPAIAAALLLAGELAVFGRALAEDTLPAAAQAGRRLAALGALALASVAAGWLLLLAAALPLAGGMLTTLVGGAAALAALGAAGLARSQR